jgi:rod shape-determining protein MreD
MNGYATISLLGLIAVAQSSLLARFAADSWHPNLMLLAVIAWSLQRGSREGMVWGFTGGLVLDLVSNAPFGVNALLLSLAGFFAGLGEARVFRTNYLLPVFIIVAISLGYFAVQALLFQLTGRSLPWLETLLMVVLPGVAANLLVSPLVFRPLRWLSRHTGREQLQL